ncbi:MAG: TadE/TadG family type IV pilus assembly protein [Candidatus Dormibacteria bacterium]
MRKAERGQVLVLFALSATAIIGLVGLGVDGAYSLYQYRLAQNGGDFASLATVITLKPTCTGSGSVLGSDVHNVIADLIAHNAPNASAGWTATYVDSGGAQITSGGTPVQVSAGQNAPAGACGTNVAVASTFPTMFEGVLGITHASVAAAATAVGSPGLLPPNATIVALDPKSGHTIYAGGSGSFNVFGDIFNNSNKGDDSVDAFQSSSMSIYGNIVSVSPHPLDNCFTTIHANPSAPPATQALCPSHTSEYVDFNSITSSQPQITDPLAYLAAPTAAANGCGGGTMTVYASTPVSGTLSPGDYTGVSRITGNAVFSPCPGGAPGIYMFEKGLAICPASGDTVTGADVMLYAVTSGSAGGGGACGQGNDGISVGGNGNTTLSSAVGGYYNFMTLFQSHASGRDIGLTDDSNSHGHVVINGIVYAHGASGSEDLLTGIGTGTGGGLVVINGVAVVDQFITGGAANLTINYLSNAGGGAAGSQFGRLTH